MYIIFDFLLCIFVLFLVVFFACKAAVKELIEATNPLNKEIKKLDKLIKIGVLNYEESQEVLEYYTKKYIKKNNSLQYTKYENILKELKETGYLNEESYETKVKKLKDYYKEQ